VTPGLRGSAEPLARRYDAALLDLDGVVYVGDHAVPHAADALTAARAAGMALAFVTNNAARTPAAVAAQLTAIGVPARADEVVTSAMAAAHQLTDLVPPPARVLVVGGDGLRAAVTEAGYVAVNTEDDDPAAVVQGYGPDVSWRDLAAASVAVRRGLPWLATNLDLTLPSPRGQLPGNGALVAVVAATTGRTPMVAGKPELPLHHEAVRRSGAQHPLVVGDRLDSDIEGAVRAGCDSLLVLTGVTDVHQLLAAPQRQRPTYISNDLGGLLSPHPDVTVAGSAVTCGGWHADRGDQEVTLRRAGDAGGDGLDALRALVTAAWLGDTTNLHVRGESSALAVAGLGPTADR
jgi:HAD superfamily hydrolase (TIGR01457 family)